MDFIAAILSSIYFAIGYISLLPARMKFKYYFYLFIFLFSIYYWFDPYFGQWLTLLLVFVSSLIIYLGCNKTLLSLSLSLTGYLILILLNHIFTIPLNIMGKSIPYLHEHFEFSVYLILILSAVIVLRLIRKFLILPKLSILYSCPNKLLFFFLTEIYIGIILMTANFIYGEKVSYPAEVLSLNGVIITVFVLSTVLIFYNMYDILKKNHELSLQQAQAAVMHDYAHRMESLYEDIRTFRHDYQNILSTMQHYIDEENNNALKEYFYRTILNCTPPLFTDVFYLGRLHYLDDDTIKSLLYTKIISILNYGINFEIEIAELIPILPMDNITLCRILGILFDNAIEASLESIEKKIHVSIISTDITVLFTITNSTLPLSDSISNLLKRGYSSKKGHDGIGLSTVSELLDSIPYANLYTKYDNMVFSQALEIQKMTAIQENKAK